MRKLLLAAMLFCVAGSLTAQTPITIKVTELTDSTRFTTTWTAVAGASFYQYASFSNPRMFDTEMTRSVTGTPTWTFTVLRSNLKDNMPIYVNITTVTTTGTLMPVRYAAITYRLPPPPTPTGIVVKKDTIPN